MELVSWVADHYWLFGILIAVALFAAYLGLLTPVEVTETDFPGAFFFYKDIQVSVKKLGPVFGEINEHIAAY